MPAKPIPDGYHTVTPYLTVRGAPKVMEPMDMFYGDRVGSVKDPSGNSWTIATHKEDVAQAELEKRAKDFFTKQKDKAA